MWGCQYLGAFNQEKALGAFSMIVKTDGLFAALMVVVVAGVGCPHT